jgi:hypothetical protein
VGAAVNLWWAKEEGRASHFNANENDQNLSGAAWYFKWQWQFEDNRH